jgi:hypothetical protein
MALSRKVKLLAGFLGGRRIEALATVPPTLGDDAPELDIAGFGDL